MPNLVAYYTETVFTCPLFCIFCRMIAKLSFQKLYDGLTFLPNWEEVARFSGDKLPKHPSESGQIQLPFAAFSLEASLEQASTKMIELNLQDIVAVIRICEAYRDSEYANLNSCQKRNQLDQPLSPAVPS